MLSVLIAVYACLMSEFKLFLKIVYLDEIYFHLLSFSWLLVYFVFIFSYLCQSYTKVHFALQIMRKVNADAVAV